MKPIRIALLDLNNQIPNQGIKNVVDLIQKFELSCSREIQVETFEVRVEKQLPRVEDFDIFLSSGGPGSPHPSGEAWEAPYFQFLDEIWNHNQNQKTKKFLFLICYSFQLAILHWELGTISKRHSYGFGIMPVHKTEKGDKEPLFAYLPDPFYAVDSRGYQFIEPNYPVLEARGVEILALEKIRPHVDFERAVMAARFSPHIVGTQFHPEAEDKAILEVLKDQENRKAMIENFGQEKLDLTLEQAQDPDKIKLTQSTLLPQFLSDSIKDLTKESESHYDS
ncbi:type 1 glutamine amidotransferase [Chryseobacterium sp. A301]